MASAATSIPTLVGVGVGPGDPELITMKAVRVLDDADVILVMVDGAIVEQGNHDELLAARGHYYRLYQSQFAAAITEEDAA